MTIDSTQVSPIANATADLIGELTGWLRGTGEFVKSQAPDVCNQIISYAIWSNAIYVGVSTALAIAMMAFARHFYNLHIVYTVMDDDDFPKSVVGKNTTHRRYQGGFIIPAVLLPIVALMQWIPVMCHCGAQLIQAIVAPKMYLLDYLSSMIR